MKNYESPQSREISYKIPQQMTAVECSHDSGPVFHEVGSRLISLVSGRRSSPSGPF